MIRLTAVALPLQKIDQTKNNKMYQMFERREENYL
jgi:hypothetical protein